MEEEFEEEGASPRPEEGSGASEEEEDEVEGEDNVSVFEMETSEACAIGASCYLARISHRISYLGSLDFVLYVTAHSCN